MKKIGHGRIPLENYHYIDGNHKMFLEVDIYLGENNEIKLIYNKQKENMNFLVIEEVN